MGMAEREGEVRVVAGAARLRLPLLFLLILFFFFKGKAKKVHFLKLPKSKCILHHEEKLSADSGLLHDLVLFIFFVKLRRKLHMYYVGMDTRSLE